MSSLGLNTNNPNIIVKNTFIRNIDLLFIKCFFEILFYSLPYLVGEAEADGGEGAAIEDAPDDAVIHCNLGALVLGDAVLAAAIHHVDKSEVGVESDVDGVVARRGYAHVVLAARSPLTQLAGAGVKLAGYHLLLCGVDLLHAALKRLVDELLLYETVCNHGAKIRIFFEMTMGWRGFFDARQQNCLERWLLG